MASFAARLVEAQGAEAGFQKTGFFGRAGQGDSGAIALGGLKVATQPRQEIRTTGVKGLIAREFAFVFHGGQQAQTSLWAISIGQRQRLVDPQDRIGKPPVKNIVKRHDLRPVGFVEIFGLCVDGADGRLQAIATCRRVTQCGFGQGNALGNPRSIPSRAVLRLKRHKFPRVATPRKPSTV